MNKCLKKMISRVFRMVFLTAVLPHTLGAFENGKPWFRADLIFTPTSLYPECHASTITALIEPGPASNGVDKGTIAFAETVSPSGLACLPLPFS